MPKKRRSTQSLLNEIFYLIAFGLWCTLVLNMTDAYLVRYQLPAISFVCITWLGFRVFWFSNPKIEPLESDKIHIYCLKCIFNLTFLPTLMMGTGLSLFILVLVPILEWLVLPAIILLGVGIGDFFTWLFNLFA